MLSLRDLIDRSIPPSPWSEGDNIPWDEPEFSKRMLAEHLTQDHDLASRRSATIEAQIGWLLSLMPKPPAKVLDLACGPGLYLNRLAAAGHSGAGIDFSPAAIDYARTAAASHRYPVEYRLDDLRTARFGSGFDVVLLLYGQLNVFRREEARTIVEKAHAALRPEGCFVIEPQTAAQVRKTGHEAPTWSSHTSGLFSPWPHLLLTESFWDETSSTATQRFYVIDAESGGVEKHALSTVAYSQADLTDLIAGTGFEIAEYRPSLTGDSVDDGLCAVVAVRTA